MDPSKLEHLNRNLLVETWSQPDGLNALSNRAVGSVKEAFPDRCDLIMCICRQELTLTDHASNYTTVDHIKKVILALQV